MKAPSQIKIEVMVHSLLHSKNGLAEQKYPVFYFCALCISDRLRTVLDTLIMTLMVRSIRTRCGVAQQYRIQDSGQRRQRPQYLHVLMNACIIFSSTREYRIFSMV